MSLVVGRITFGGRREGITINRELQYARRQSVQAMETLLHAIGVETTTKPLDHPLPEPDFDFDNMRRRNDAARKRLRKEK